MALSHALLRAVAAGERPPSARIYRPGPTVAFGRLDTLHDGFSAARDAAAARGWAPLLRLGGGRAAAYDEGSVVVELVTATTASAAGLQERFADGVAIVTGALGRLAVSAEVGELPGEYCPGRWSVHLPGGPKIAGAAQRSVRGASLVTAVVVVEGGARVREVLVDVYAALATAWAPATAGAVADHHPDVGATQVVDALVAELARAHPGLVGVSPDAALLAAARTLAPRHAR